jgi:hypothetical protein
VVRQLYFASPADLAGGISALMTSIYKDRSNPPSADPNVCFGWRLAHFLRELGPGTTKTGQYGDSLWMTPEAWLEGLISFLKPNAREDALRIIDLILAIFARVPKTVLLMSLTHWSSFLNSRVIFRRPMSKRSL